MSREDPQMKIRLPADLKDWIDKSAAENGRSMNAEIVARLQMSFDKDLISPDVQQFIVEAIKNHVEHIKQTKGDKK